MIKRVLVVGGANGIGLSISIALAARETTEKVFIVDKADLAEEYHNPNLRFAERYSALKLVTTKVVILCR